MGHVNRVLLYYIPSCDLGNTLDLVMLAKNDQPYFVGDEPELEDVW